MGLLRWVPLIYTAIFTIAFVFIGLRSALVDLEPNNCKMTYMWPQYVSVKGMKHPKYDLYFYREGETKPMSYIPKLSGVPVLFIPGNAGSYRQVRSLGSVSAWTHSSRNLSNLHDSDLSHIKLQAPPVRGKKFNEFDFFTADFDEELTALNGDLLFNQIDFVNDCIKYILSLYNGEKGQKPTSVILVGHSMGGLVARGAFAAANYNPGSIKTIITINSPHRVDPLLFHRSSGRSYRIVNGFWKEELYNPDKLANSALKDVAVLSIAGGNRDIQVSSDLSSLELIAPETHQFSTIATSVPYVWLSTDHLSSVWCNQLVYVLSETLFDLIDPATKQDTYPLEDRMRIFKQQFQSKLPEALSFVDALPDLHRATVQDTEKWIGRPYAEAFVHHHTITQTKHMKWHISENYHEYKFTMITGLPKEGITAKLCKADFVDCLDLGDKITPVLHSVEPGVREFDTKIVPMNILVLMPDALKGYDYLLVEVQPPKQKQPSFFIAQWYGLAESRIVVEPPMFKEYMITLPKQHPIIVDFVFEGLSKFQALSFKVERKECSTTIKQIADDLKSVVVQLNEETKEEKHSSLPVTVIKYEICSQNKTQCFNNIHVLLFSHPGCEYEIEISPSIFESLGQVFRGYLMLGIACCFAATFFIMFQQFRRYRKTGVYPSLWESLRDVHYNYVTVIFVIISFVDVVIGPIFTDAVFTLTQEFLRHGLLTLPYPWPNLPILFMLHFLAISIVGIWYLAASLLYFVLTFRIGFRAENDKPKPEKFSFSFVFVLYMLIIGGSFFFLHYSVTLIIALVYFLFSMKYYQNQNKWHFAQTLFVLYSFLLIIVIPSLVIWVKDLKYGWKWPDMEFAVLLIAIHVYVVRFLELPKGKSISYLMLLASAAVELACLHTVYRMMSVLIGVTLIFMIVPLFNKPGNNNDDDNCNNRNEKKLGAKEDKKSNDNKKLLKPKNNTKQSAKNNK